MPDWQSLVQKHLAANGLASAAEKEVVAELAAHLEDDYDESIAAGMVPSEAEGQALGRVSWRRLARKLRDAKRSGYEPGRNGMNSRTKKLWVPALASLTLTALLLLFLDKIHAGALAVRIGHLAMAVQLAWFSAMPLLGQTKSEESIMNPRTRSIWMPGFVSLTTASLLMFAEEIVLQHDPSFYFTNLSLHPSPVIFGLPRWFYLVWLLVQLPCGALGAFLSRRGGGTRTARLVAGAFPALLMFLLCGLAMPVSALFEPNSFVLHHPWSVAFGILIWAGAPALAVVLGAAPFLKEPSPQRA